MGLVKLEATVVSLSWQGEWGALWQGGTPPSVWGCPRRSCLIPCKAPEKSFSSQNSRLFQWTERSLLFFGKLHIPESNLEKPDLWVMERSIWRKDVFVANGTGQGWKGEVRQMLVLCIPASHYPISIALTYSRCLIPSRSMNAWW
jgi:hypothetical protein